MNKEDIDNIIAEAVADSQHQSKKKWHKGKPQRNTDTVRLYLNWIFMVGFVAAIVLYFVLPEQKILFFSVGFGAIIIKVIEFYIRFMV